MPIRNSKIAERAHQVLINVDTCAYCGRKGKPGSQKAQGPLDPDGKYWCMDHVYPLSAGGADSLRNMVKSCWKCNEEKSVFKWRPNYGTITAARTIALADPVTEGPRPTKQKYKLKAGYRPPAKVVERRKKRLENPIQIKKTEIKEPLELTRRQINIKITSMTKMEKVWMVVSQQSTQVQHEIYEKLKLRFEKLQK